MPKPAAYTKKCVHSDNLQVLTFIWYENKENEEWANKSFLGFFLIKQNML